MPCATIAGSSVPVIACASLCRTPPACDDLITDWGIVRGALAHFFSVGVYRSCSVGPISLSFDNADSDEAGHAFQFEAGH